MTCDYCRDHDGYCCYPYYGLAPHNSNLENPIGGTEFLSKEEWPDNFKPDPVSPTHGTYEYCPICGDGGIDDY